MPEPARTPTRVLSSPRAPPRRGRRRQRLVAGDERVLEAVVHAARVLLVDDALVVKVADLRRELGGEVGGVEAIDHPTPEVPRQELVVELVVVVAEAGHEAHAGDTTRFLGSVSRAMAVTMMAVFGRGSGADAVLRRAENGRVLLQRNAPRRLGRRGRRRRKSAGHRRFGEVLLSSPLRPVDVPAGGARRHGAAVGRPRTDEDGGRGERLACRFWSHCARRARESRRPRVHAGSARSTKAARGARAGAARGLPGRIRPGKLALPPHARKKIPRGASPKLRRRRAGGARRPTGTRARPRDRRGRSHSPFAG